MADEHKEKKQLTPSLLAGSGVTGLAMAASLYQHPSTDNLFGLRTLYHGTKDEYVPSILQEGLLGRHANRPDSVTHQFGLAKLVGEDVLKNKVYFTTNKEKAANLYTFDPDGRQVITARLPRMELENGDFRVVGNPELRGMGEDEWVNTRLKEMSKDLQEQHQFPKGMADELVGKHRDQAQYTYRNLGEPNVLTIEGDVAPKYIKGSKFYRPQSVRGFLEYAKHHPGVVGGELKKVAPSAALGTLGLAGLAGSAALALKNKENNKKE